MSLARLITVLALVVGLAACDEAGDQAGTDETKGAKPVAYTISKRDGELLKQIGILRFDEANNATLEEVASGPDGEALRQVWEEVSQRSHLAFQENIKVEEDGKEITEFGTAVVPKGHEEYNVAVWDTLQREFHYHIDRLQD